MRWAILLLPLLAVLLPAQDIGDTVVFRHAAPPLTQILGSLPSDKPIRVTVSVADDNCYVEIISIEWYSLDNNNQPILPSAPITFTTPPQGNNPGTGAATVDFQSPIGTGLNSPQVKIKWKVTCPEAPVREEVGIVGVDW